MIKRSGALTREQRIALASQENRGMWLALAGLLVSVAAGLGVLALSASHQLAGRGWNDCKLVSGWRVIAFYGRSDVFVCERRPVRDASCWPVTPGVESPLVCAPVWRKLSFDSPTESGYSVAWSYAARAAGFCTVPVPIGAGSVWCGAGSSRVFSAGDYLPAALALWVGWLLLKRPVSALARCAFRLLPDRGLHFPIHIMRGKKVFSPPPEV